MKKCVPYNLKNEIIILNILLIFSFNFGRHNHI